MTYFQMCIIKQIDFPQIKITCRPEASSDHEKNKTLAPDKYFIGLYTDINSKASVELKWVLNYE